MNKKISTVRPELHPVPVKSPWHHIGVDFVGPISPPSSTGNRYVMTVSDYFTKFSWAKALPSKEAVNVVSTLREVSAFSLCVATYFKEIYNLQLFYIMGLPSVITTDQGKAIIA